MCEKKMLDLFRTKSGYDFSQIFSRITDTFSQSDIVIGNLETPISFDDTNLTTDPYCFNSPFEFAEAAYKSGIRIVSTANNHCLDRGITGINSTIKSLNKIGIKHTGVYSSKGHSPLIVECKNIKIGIMSYTYGTNAFNNNYYLNKNNNYCVNLFQNQELSNKIEYSLINNNHLFIKIIRKILVKILWFRYHKPVYERREFSYKKIKTLKKDIKELKKQSDILIMCMHIGGQYSKKPSSYTKSMSKFLQKQGVEIIVGNHEHVIHPGDFSGIDNNNIITYSLGNFDCGDAVSSLPTKHFTDYSIALNVYLDVVNKRISKATYTILKCRVIDNQKIQTVPLCDLIFEETNPAVKENLICDLYKASKLFGFNIDGMPIKKEYEIYN